MIKLSDYIFHFLENKGITNAFILPGGGAMHLVDSLGKSNMEYVCFQHEQGAAIAAEAYGQHTNYPGLLLVTSGPGATNAITGVTAGWIDSTPMFVISGQSKRADLVGEKKVRQIGSQEVQIIPMVEPITKYAVQIMEPETIRYHLERAYYEAVSGRPGPVWLSIPLDVQGSIIDEEKLTGYVPDATDEADISDDINKTAELLMNSKKPVLLAGNGIKLANAMDKFYELLDVLHIPVLTTWKSIDFLGEEHPMYIGHPGIMGDRGANLILQESDLLISVGCRIDTSMTAFNDAHFARNAKKVIVDVDINEINRMGMTKDISCACDAGYFLDSMISTLRQCNEADDLSFDMRYQDWIDDCKLLRAQYPTVTEAHKDTVGHVSAYYFIDELCKLLKKDDVIVPESSGGAGEITYQAFKLKYGQKMKNAAGLGAMGFGLPYAIGSCIANNRKRTILINGDGAFQLNIQELETLHRLQLPIKIFIWDNNGYASIRAMQNSNFFGHLVASSETSGMTFPDITAIAKAYGLKAYKLMTNEEMVRKLPAILDEGGMSLCIISTSPEETVWPRVKARVLPDGGIVSGNLEDMWPYESK